jgi:hypothetical protein
VRFVAPLGAARTPDGVFAGLNLADATQVDYIAERYKRIPADKRDTYHVLEGGVVELRKEGKNPPDLRCRRIFVYSSANARAQATNRARKLGRAQPDLEKLARNAGTRHYPDSDAVTAKLTALASKYRVTAYLRSTITTDPDGKPHLQWDFDQAAIAAEAASDGWYALITNIPADQASPAEIFLGYTFRPRKALHKNRKGSFTGFLPGVSAEKLTEMSRKAQAWKLNRRTTLTLAELAEATNPVLAGWLVYFTRYYPTAVIPLCKRMNRHLVRWAKGKYKRLERSGKRAWAWLAAVVERAPRLFAHWKYCATT